MVYHGITDLSQERDLTQTKCVIALKIIKIFLGFENKPLTISEIVTTLHTMMTHL